MESLKNAYHDASLPTASVIGSLFLTLILCYLLFSITYNVWFHPLSGYPGPFWARATTIPRVVEMVRGNQSSWTTRLHLKHGHVVRVAPNELSYSSAQSFKDIYGAQSKTSGRKWSGLYDKRNPVFRSSVNTVQEHAALRRIFNPGFSEKAIRGQEPVMRACAHTMANRLRRYIIENPDKPADIAKMWMYSAFDIMGDFVFGHPLGMVDRMEYIPWIRVQFENLNLGLWMSSDILNGPLHFAIGEVDRRLESNPKKPDVWSHVMAENKSGRQLTREETHTHAVLFIIAGTETTATALAGLTYYFLTCSDVKQRLTKEIRDTFKSPEDVNLQDLKNLPYLHACVNETLRLYPPIQVGVPRVTPPEGSVIDGQVVAGNTVVYASPAAHVHPLNFKDPEKFIPERWTSDEYENDVKSALQPFILGPRNCIGQSLANHEIRFMFASLLCNFDIDLAPESTNWLKQQKVYFVSEKVPLMVKLTPITAW